MPGGLAVVLLSCLCVSCPWPQHILAEVSPDPGRPSGPFNLFLVDGLFPWFFLSLLLCPPASFLTLLCCLLAHLVFLHWPILAAFFFFLSLSPALPQAHTTPLGPDSGMSGYLILFTTPIIVSPPTEISKATLLLSRAITTVYLESICWVFHRHNFQSPQPWNQVLSSC